MFRRRAALSLLSLCLLSPLAQAAGQVYITPDLEGVEINHQGTPLTVRRNPDTANTIPSDFARTSRPCPPFCVQPMQLAPGVETIGELEMLDYMRKVSWGDDTILMIDSRTPDWVAKGTIPGAVNIPWTSLRQASGADPLQITDILTEQFGAREDEGIWDFSGVRTLVMFCNGAWCGQSPTNIKALLRMGYPAHRIKWYRGGMQAWASLGFTTVQP